jgi:mitochondrial chaperone BCS1
MSGLNTLLSAVQSQLFAGGFLLMAVGSIIAILKDIPKKIWAILNHQFTASVKITDEAGAAFLGISQWIQQQRFFGRIRQIDTRKFKNEANRTELFFIPSPGTHWFFHRWRLMWFSFDRTEGKGFDVKYNENFVLGMVGRDKEFLKKIVREATTELKAKTSGVQLSVWTSGYWQTIAGYKPRTFDSVILPTEEKRKLERDIQWFLDNEAIYLSSGTPYRRGYMFYGLPGTGKTSSVAGLSSKFKRDVYMLQPQHIGDGGLASAIADVPMHSIVVIEDVDCIASTSKRKLNKKEKQEKKDGEEKKDLGVTLSGLLNSLDGLKVPHGLLFFLTTNHIEKLDPALIRPGRVDFKLEFKWATKEQKEEYFKKFLNQTVPTDLMSKKVTMAEVQQRALEIQNGEK